jgi:hypothetical protein
MNKCSVPTVNVELFEHGYVGYFGLFGETVGNFGILWAKRKSFSTAIY